MQTSIQKPPAVYFEQCRVMHARYGTSYYFATRFFPRSLREATYALYAFLRVPDEIVDNARPEDTVDDVRMKIDSWIESWKSVRKGDSTEDPVLACTSWVFDAYDIKDEYADVFLKAMRSDTEVSRFETYADVETYMYGSAAAPGLMMTSLIGYDGGPETLNRARDLGYAMQLTNFLRDIHDDYISRNRIYMPADEMARFGVTEAHIQQKKVDEAFILFMKFQIARARALYRSADIGLYSLRLRGRVPVAIASALYEGILDEIERLGYNVFVARARTSTIRKIYLAFRACARLIFHL